MNNVVNTVLENLSVDRPVGKDVGSHETLNLLLGPDPAVNAHEAELQIVGQSADERGFSPRLIPARHTGQRHGQIGQHFVCRRPAEDVQTVADLRLFQLAEEIVDGLGPERSTSVHVEIDRRVAEVEAGTAKLIPAEDVLRELRTKFAAPRRRSR